MTKHEIEKMLRAHKKWLDSDGQKGAMARFVNSDLKIADLVRADLREALLDCANLEGANLFEANLNGAYLRDANLCGANLAYADLYDANLKGANLKHANLTCANLFGAKLDNADLSGANLDFSCWPIWCGSLNVKIDARIAAQLMYHCMRAMQSVQGDSDIAKVLSNKDCIRLANRFHRIKECGEIIKNKKGETR